MMKYSRSAWLLALLCLLATVTRAAPSAAEPRDGDDAQPLRVLLIPADGGTEDGTKADFLPLFTALSRVTGDTFDVRAGQSYAAVIEGLCAGVADIAWFGPVSYITARDRGCAELLAMEVTKGSAVYYSGIFVRAGAEISGLTDLAGKSLALGSPHSTSSFVYPLAMIRQAGLDPVEDLAAIRLTGSHANSIQVLQAGLVDAAGASLVSLARAIDAGAVQADELKIIARSAAIPNPPLAVRADLPEAVKQRLRAALGAIHEDPTITPGMIRGYGGKVVDRYDSTVTDAVIDTAGDTLSIVDDALRTDIIRKAGRQ